MTEKSTRSSREAGERQHEKREVSMRPSIKYYHLSTSNLDASIIPEGMRYAKITKECRGQKMDANVRQALQMGYRPVPKSRHPELCMADDILVSLNGGVGKIDHIEDRDHILMEISEKEYAQIEAENQQRTQNQVRFVNEFNDWRGDEHVHLTRPQSATRFEAGGITVGRSTNFGR